MSSASISTERISLKISDLEARLAAQNATKEGEAVPGATGAAPGSLRLSRPRRLCDPSSPLPPRHEGTPTRSRKELALQGLPSYNVVRQQESVAEIDAKMREIMKQNGVLTINGKKYLTLESGLEHIGDLGYGTCGHVVKMVHRESSAVIAVKQMRRSGNKEENKRIIMDIEVVLKSHDCPFIVQSLGCFITDADVWICMELMATCFDKLLKRTKTPVPEPVLGKVTVATVKALHYLKETHGVIHRDVKPSNILLDELGNVKLCDFGISGRLVDSKAKTRGAGCAAYMAPERIDPPNPTNPDYDIRADVWSLGITLVELAVGHFPYTNCKTDFEVLTKVINEDPPSLPPDSPFSPEFQHFVSNCLTKNYKKRPKYRKLLEEPFLVQYEKTDVDMATWYADTLQTGATSPPSVSSTAPSAAPSPSYSNASTNTVTSPTAALSPTYANASTNTPITSPIRKYTPPSCGGGSVMCGASPTPPRRHGVFNHSQFHQRNASEPRFPPSEYHHHHPHHHQPLPPRYYSDQPIYGRPAVEARLVHERLQVETLPPSIPPRYFPSERKRHPSEPFNHPNGTPPPIYNRAFSFSPPPAVGAGHHRSHSPAAGAVGAAADAWFASYLQLQLGRSPPPYAYERPPSPPPRASRLHAAPVAPDDSPRLLRRAFLDATRRSLGAEHRYASPSLPRRHVSPAPPEPPPRRMVEGSASVPGSPQHGRAAPPPLRLRYQCTPEPQRRGAGGAL